MTKNRLGGLFGPHRRLSVVRDSFRKKQLHPTANAARKQENAVVYSGSSSRSFSVGEGITEQDITAKFEDGTLKLSVPKKQAVPQQPNRYIAID